MSSSLQIDKSIYKYLMEYCKKRNIKVGHFVEGLICQRIGLEIIPDPIKKKRKKIDEYNS